MKYLLHLFALLQLMLMVKGDKADPDESDDDTDEDTDEDDEGEGDEGDEDAEGDDDAEGDEDELTPEEQVQLRADLKKANREASRARRALKAGKRPKKRAADQDPDTAVAERVTRVAVKELLVDNGLPTAAAKLLNLALVDMEDGELTDPEDVLEQVRDEMEALGLELKVKDDDDAPPTKRRPAKRQLPKDKSTRKADSGKSTGQLLAEQAGLA